jgi:type VI secretion system secreted protein VgrG
MYYWFEQGDDGEKLVISDAKSFQEKLAPGPVRYHALAGHDHSAGDSLHAFRCKHRALPARVKFKDYDYTKPTLEVSGAAPVSSTGLGEISIHGARFFSPDDGRRLASLRAEELLCRQVVYDASGSAFHLRAGYFFALQDHPRTSFDAEYLAIELTHTGNQTASSDEVRKLCGLEGDEVYRVDLTAIPSSVQFRAKQETPWPRIYGYENGTICGPAESEYAQIDEHGRYNVKFKFDESDLKEGKASTWVRMMQPHGGSIEGWHFPLRKGTEVVFSFLGGDPDRPVISGVVPNAHTPSPVTRGNHTTNVIQTGGRNRLELEDTAGSQRITLQTPHTNTMIRMGAPNDEHNLIVRTDGRTLLDAGQDWDVTVGGHLDERVKGPVYEEYKNTRETHVAEDAKEFWNAALTSYTKGETSQTYQGDHKVYSWSERHDEVGGELKQIYHSPVERTLFATLEEKISGTAKHEVGGKVTFEHKAGFEQTVTGAAEQKATGEWKLTAPTVEVTSTGAWKWSCLGDHVALQVNCTSETLIGIKNENLIGGKIESCVGLKAEFVAAAQIEAAVGPHLFENPIATMEGLMLMLEFALIDCGSATVMVEAGAVVIV